MRIAYFDRYAPLSELGSDGRVRGVLVQRAHSVMTSAGFAVSHHAYPWRRAQAMVANGEMDGFCTTATDERLSYAKFSSQAVLVNEHLLFHRKDDRRLAHLTRREELRPLRQGAYFGSGYTRQHLEVDRLVMDRDVDALIRRVARGDLDVFVEGSRVAWHRIEALGLSDRFAATAAPFLPAASFRLGLRQSWPDLEATLARVDQAILSEQRRGWPTDAAAGPR